MKYTKVLSLIAILSLLVFTGVVFAQDQPAPTGPAAAQPPPIDRSGLSGSLYRLSTLDSIPIVEIEGVQAPEPAAAAGAPADTPANGAAAPGMATARQTVTYGRVQDEIITADGQVSHLLLNLDDIEGVEGGLYLAAMDQVDIRDNGVTVNAAPQDLTAVEDEEKAAEQAGADSYLASRIADFSIVGSDGEDLGSIEDFVVDIEKGRIIYAAMGRGGVLGIGQDLFAIPFDALTFEPDEEQARIDATEAEFEDREGFPGDQWPSSAPGQS